MAVKYLDAKRIRGVKGWSSVLTGWSQPSSNVIKVTGGSWGDTFRGFVYELPEKAGDTFLLRYTLNVTATAAYSSGQYQYACFLGGLSEHGLGTCMNESGGVGLNYATNSTYNNPKTTYGMTCLTSSLGGDVPSGDSFGVPSGTKYIEVVGTDADDFEVRVYTNSDYSGTPTTKTQTRTGMPDLNYLRFSGGSFTPIKSASGSITAEISDVKFWNNQTTSSGDPDVQGFSTDKATLLNSSAVGSDGNWTTVTALTADTSTATPTNLDTASWSADGEEGSGTTKISLTGGQIFPKDSSFTFSTWIKPNLDDTYCIIDDDGGTNSVVIFVQASGEALEFIVKNDSGTASGGEGSYTFNADSWYNIVCTFDKDTTATKGYVNYSNNPVSDTTAGVTSCATNTSWKMMGNGSTETFGGLMLETAIWNKVLTDNERRDLYYGGSGGSGGSAGAGKKANTIASDNLICYWDGSDITAPITNDGINKSNLPENTLFEETDVKTFTNSQSNAGIVTYWLQDGEWKKGYDTLVLDHSSSTGNENSFDDRTAIGEQILANNSLIGKKVKSIKVKLKKGNGSPTSDIVMNVVNDPSGSSYGTVKHTFGSALEGGAVLTSSYVEYEFVASSPYTVVVNDCFIVQLTSGTETDNHSGSHYFLMDCKDTAQSNSKMEKFQDSGGWSDSTSKGCYMKFYGSAT